MRVAADAAEPRSRARRRGVRFTHRAAVLALVLTALLLYLMVPLRAYLEQRAKLGQLQRQEQVLVKANEDLMRDVAKLQDPAYIEMIARQCLGMIRPGEIAFSIVPRSGQATPPPCTP